MYAHKVSSAVQVIFEGCLLLLVDDVIRGDISYHQKEDRIVVGEICISERIRVFRWLEFYIMRGTSSCKGVDGIRNGVLRPG